MSEGFDRYPWLKTSSAEQGGADLRKAAKTALHVLDNLAHDEDGEPCFYGWDAADVIKRLRAALTTQPQAEPVAEPEGDGWALYWVRHLPEMMSALNRASNKGYMPDAMADEYDAFDYREAAPTVPTEPT